ncbi:MAG: ATP-binding cassette domain-containing protein [Tabrizicola sp.]|nr:ATP-binding cassette domain-containing protein [Tabrizicola sp.]
MEFRVPRSCRCVTCTWSCIVGRTFLLSSPWFAWCIALAVSFALPKRYSSKVTVSLSLLNQTTVAGSGLSNQLLVNLPSLLALAQGFGDLLNTKALVSQLDATAPADVYKVQFDEKKGVFSLTAKGETPQESRENAERLLEISQNYIQDNISAAVITNISALITQSKLDLSSAQGNLRVLQESLKQTPSETRTIEAIIPAQVGGSSSAVSAKSLAQEIRRGETFALVGESGCGKSTLAKAMVGLVPHGGRIEIAGQALTGLSGEGRKMLRRRIQIVFQDPMAALDPRMRVGDLIAEPLVIHRIGTAAEQRARVADLMARVGLSADQASRYPHEFSGGQRQRICIARALALNPDLIIADESVSALDVSVQARVLDLLRALQSEFGIALLFISHDMAVVENISDHVAVMYLGQIVEMGSRAQIFGTPRHPYTRRLIEAVPVPDPRHIRPPEPRLAGDVPSPVHAAGHPPARLTLTDIGDGHLVAGL